MDPIHPILPQRVNIPPVSEPPRIGRIDRDERREKDRRREPDEQRERHPGDDDVDPGMHVDITA